EYPQRVGGQMREIGVAACLVIALFAGPARAEDHSVSAVELAAQGLKAFGRKEFALATQLYPRAPSPGAQSPETAYNGACAAALAGDKAGGLALPDKAVALGLHDAGEMQADADLASLRGEPGWAKLIAAVGRNAALFAKTHSSPEGARFITSDIDLFWKAFDK